MPTISMFYGIIIRMFFDEHQPPHFHATYQGIKSVFSIDGVCTEGKLPNKQRKLVEAWAALHSDELVANWDLARNGESLFVIDPLK